MRRELIRKVSGCIVLVIVLVASSPIRGETAPATPDAEQGLGRDSPTLKLDPDTQKLLQRLADSREAPSEKTQSDDSWDKEKFTTLMSTLWQAPLAILAIVLAIGGFFGWQGYKDLSDRLQRNLSDKLIGEARTVVGFSLVLGQITAGFGIWRLAVELQLQEANGGKPFRSCDDRDQAEKEFGKKLLRTDAVGVGAASHMRAARSVLSHAIKNVDQLPDDADVRVTGRLRSGIVRLEAKQSYAYYTATDHLSEPGDWEDALRFSREALTATQDQNWLEAQLEGDKRRARSRAVEWTDTFIYVRVQFSRVARSLGDATRERAAREMNAARQAYEHLPLDDAYDDVRERFRDEFGR